MSTDTCANPDCDPGPLGGTRDHWVQIEELRLVGEMRGQGPVQRRFAAVTCSKRCAAAVLTSAADADDAAAAREPNYFEDLIPRT